MGVRDKVENHCKYYDEGTLSVRLGVLLHSCASGASYITCPHTLLTSCCVHAWQDRFCDQNYASP